MLPQKCDQRFGDVQIFDHNFAAPLGVIQTLCLKNESISRLESTEAGYWLKISSGK
jgi:hypothetical protein